MAMSLNHVSTPPPTCSPCPTPWMAAMKASSVGVGAWFSAVMIACLGTCARPKA